ncbi:hypothetical protein HMI56_004747, partial [Coelomomyces lativittatus]
RPVLDIDVKYETWMQKYLNKLLMSAEELLEFRLSQIIRMEKDLSEVKEMVKDQREQRRENQQYSMIERGEEGDLVLLHKGKFNNSFTGKIESRWNGLYILLEKDQKKAKLVDLNGK